MKKLTALFMALVMMMAMATTASAADDGKITIANATTGTVYEVYKVFDLEEYDTTKGHYFFKVDPSWKGFVTGSGAGASYVTVDGGDYVFKEVSFDAEDFATAAHSYATSKPIGATATATAAGATVEINNLPHGYYIVKSSRGSTFGAVTVISGGMVNGSGASLASINEKNTSLPHITKEVQEDDGVAWGDTNVAAIDETVKFKIVVAAGEGGKFYKIQDTLAGGFTFDDTSVEVTYDGTLLAKTADYDVSVSGQVVTFDLKKYCDKNHLVANKKFEITYSAKLNSNATIAGAGNKNDVKLAYDSVELNTTDKIDSTTTYTYQFVLQKTDGTDQIEGAKFELKDSNDTVLEFVYDSENKVYKPSSAGDASSEIVAGNVTIAGLDNGAYTLTETKAPDGYIKADSIPAITINNANGDKVTVVNNAGQPLPETGGMGTTVFYLSGAVLMMAAGVLMLSKKRRFA